MQFTPASLNTESSPTGILPLLIQKDYRWKLCCESTVIQRLWQCSQSAVILGFMNVIFVLSCDGFFSSADFKCAVNIYLLPFILHEDHQGNSFALLQCYQNSFVLFRFVQGTFLSESNLLQGTSYSSENALGTIKMSISSSAFPFPAQMEQRSTVGPSFLCHRVDST